MPHVIEFPVHIGDFLSGTMHMSAQEIGAYTMLIMAHMQTGEHGLPNDDNQLARIARVTPRVWKKIRPILEPKFNVTADFWEHKRCQKVLRKISEKSNAARDKALKRHKSGDAKASSQQCRSNANQKPITNIIKKKNKQKKENTEKFMQFWEVYPRHRRGNKENAWRAWCKSLEEGRATEDEMLAGAKSYAASDPGEFAKGAAAWLNDDRWTWQASNSDIRLGEEAQEWPPWKRHFAGIIGEKAVFSWFKDADYRSGILIVAKKFQQDYIRQHYSDDLQKLGLTEIKLSH